MDRELTARVLEVARAEGLVAGVAPADVFSSTRRHLYRRKARGLHGEMAFTYRNPDRSTDPARLLATARALVVGALPYGPVAPPPRPSGGPHGRVARYAWRDRYVELRRHLEAVAAVLRDAGHRAVVVADSNALVDREAAVRAGLGWYGKNANVLVPGAGSWFVLGSVVTDAILRPSAERARDRCRSCRRCLDHCPTGAIVAPGVVDARRCLAWVVQAPGPIPAGLRELVADRLYGCDDCQDVCPPNVVHARDGMAVSVGPQDEAWVDAVALLDADDPTLLARHGRWYLAERDPRHLRRNALVVLGNVGDPADPEVRRVVRHALDADDPLVRGHAVWAAARLGLLDDLERRRRAERHPFVIAELDAAPEPRASV